MTLAQRREAVTHVSDHVPRLLIISDLARRWQESLTAVSAVVRGWQVEGQLSAAEVVRASADDAPDLVAIDLPSYLADVRALFEHAKAHWPRTSFVLYSSRPEVDARDLVEAYGDMPVLSAPTIASLAASLEREMEARSLGLFHGLSLPSMLQLLHLDRKSVGLLVYAGSRWGRLHLRAGQLMEAYVHGVGLTGEAAALEILSWVNVTLYLERSYHNQHQTITRPLTTLLMEAMQRHDERSHSVQAESGVFFPDAFDPSLLITENSEPPEEASMFRRPSRRAESPPAPDASPPPSTPTAPPFPEPHPKEYNMANVKSTLDSAMSDIDGALATALVDYQSGMALGTAGGGVNLEVAAAGNTEVVRAKLRTMSSLGIQGSIEDILITLDTQYHIIYLVPNQTLFLYLVLAKDRANLAMARYKLKALGSTITL